MLLLSEIDPICIGTSVRPSFVLTFSAFSFISLFLFFSSRFSPISFYFTSFFIFFYISAMIFFVSIFSNHLIHLSFFFQKLTVVMKNLKRREKQERKKEENVDHVLTVIYINILIKR